MNSVSLMALAAATSVTACAAHARPTPQLEAAARQHEIEILTTSAFGLAVPEDAVVRVVGPRMTCSGTLISDNEVLTAHHCVVRRGPRGEFLSSLVSADQVAIELGGDFLPWGTAAVKAVVAPPCGEAGGRGDLAVMVLDRKVILMNTFKARLDAPPRRGEFVRPMGFGHCALSPDGIRRRARDGGDILGLAAGTFSMTASVCPGDSGGPLIAPETNEVVGVVSLSAMDNDESTRSASVMARLDSFRLVFAHAHAIANGTDESDLPPLSCDP